jgi:hypothetical protein
MWRICKEASRPWPVLSEDPVIDYMIMEAVALRVHAEDEKERKNRERQEWKKKKAAELQKQYG